MAKMTAGELNLMTNMLKPHPLQTVPALKHRVETYVCVLFRNYIFYRSLNMRCNKLYFSLPNQYFIHKGTDAEAFAES